MDSTDAMERVVEAVRDELASSLRDVFPYLKTEALEQLLQDTGDLVKSRIKQQAPIMAASNANMSFMSLPPELRNNIYEMVLPKPREYQTQGVRVARGGYSRGFYLDTPRSRVPNIAKVSRQTQQEALSLYYGENRFSVYIDSRNIKTPHHDGGMPRESIAAKAHKWLHHIGPQSAALIKRLSIEVPLPMDDCTCRRATCVRDLPCQAWHFGSTEKLVKLLKLHRYGVPPSSFKVLVGTKIEYGDRDIMWRDAVKEGLYWDSQDVIWQQVGKRSARAVAKIEQDKNDSDAEPIGNPNGHESRDTVDEDVNGSANSDDSEARDLVNEDSEGSVNSEDHEQCGLFDDDNGGSEDWSDCENRDLVDEDHEGFDTDWYD